MILLDTTVLVYAVGLDHPLAEPARTIIERVRVGDLRAHTTPEVIQEFAHVRARRRSRDEAAELARAYAALLSPLHVTEQHHLEEGLRLWSRTPGLGCFDAVLAAVAISLDAELISADTAFAQVPGLRWRMLGDEEAVDDGPVRDA